MNKADEIIERAQELLQPIDFRPYYSAYFVMQNDEDAGGEDYCINCIEEAVKETRKSYFHQRQSIIDKFQEIEKEGKYSAAEIAQAKRRELKEYPARVTFSYEGHDPDFSGGQHEPLTCLACGDYFETDFVPDIEEAENILQRFEYDLKSGNVSDVTKWKLDIAFNNYEYVKKDVAKVLLSIAERIVVGSE